jgi:phage protein D
VARILAKYADYGIEPRVFQEKIEQPPREQLRVEYQTATDLAYVTDLARANGYIFFLEPGPRPGRSTAVWGPEIRIGQRQHALNVNMDANSTVDQLTFAYDGTAREEPQARVQNPATRDTLLLPQPDIGPLRPPLGRRATPALRRRTLSGTAKKESEQAQAELLARAALSADAISGSGSLDVNRHGYILRPRELVGVRGAGVTYDGDYYVKSVTHNIRPGSYQQNFTLSREGLIARSGTVRP